MKKPQDITDQLAAVFGGNAALMQQAATMQGYIDCTKDAQDKLNAGRAEAMSTAETKSPVAGMTQMVDAGKSFQQGMAACAKKFPLK